MKKHLPFLLAAVLCGSGLASAQPEFAKADSAAAAFAGAATDPAELARQLAQPFGTEREKARVLFAWIARNIRYDVAKAQNPPRPHFSGRTKEQMLEQAARWQEKETLKSLKAKRGICADYSRLYKAMCEAVGLECEIVTGDARDFFKPYRNVHDNPHAWNAVKIDGQWRLLDATWGAGYVRDGKFVRSVAPGFFMTPPAWFAQNHLPDEERWQLLEAPVGKKDFPNQPVVHYGQDEYPVVDFSPSVEASGKEAVIRLKLSRVPKAFQVVVGKTKPVASKVEEKDGWVLLRFAAPGAGREVAVFGGESPRSAMGWLARYETR